MSVSLVRSHITAGSTSVGAGVPAVVDNLQVIGALMTNSGAGSNATPPSGWSTALSVGPATALGEYLAVYWRKATAGNTGGPYTLTNFGGSIGLWYGELASTVGWGTNPVDRTGQDIRTPAANNPSISASAAMQRPHGFSLALASGGGGAIGSTSVNNGFTNVIANRGALAYRLETATVTPSVTWTVGTAKTWQLGMVVFTEEEPAVVEGYPIGLKVGGVLVDGTLKMKVGGVLV